MKMAHETDVLKSQNTDLLTILDELRTFLGLTAQKGIPLHEVEQTVWKQVLLMGRCLFGEYLARFGTGDLGETITTADGQIFKRLPNLHERRYVSIFGEFRLQRTAYGSREGQKIEFVPLDNWLQLPDSVFSYLLQDWDQRLCVEEAFDQASGTVARILGFKQSVDSLERMNVRMGKHVEEFREERELPAAQEEGEIVVSSADGKGVVMRREKGENVSSSHRTKGEKASRKEMAIVGAVYTVDRYVRTPEEVVAALFGDDRDQPKRDRPKPCHKQTIANLAFTDQEWTLSGIDQTYLWLMEEIRLRNHDGDKEMVHLCDGQEALWEAREEYLSRRKTTDILDLLHVTPRLWQAAHLFHPEKSDAAEEFVRERLLRVLEGKVELVVRGLRVMGTKCHLKGNKKTTLIKLCGYLDKNRDRMRYNEYLAKGYPIASGVIEGACRHLVKDRMERAGMHWTREGAQAMLDMRSIHVNGDWDQYQTFRIECETSRLYPYRELAAEIQYSLAV